MDYHNYNINKSKNKNSNVNNKNLNILFWNFRSINARKFELEKN